MGYELDALFHPSLIRSGKYSINVNYDSFGRKKRLSYPNKLETVFSFDGLERLEEISTPDVGFRSYEYDPLSNISQIKSESGQLDYAYDMNSSLIGAYYKGGDSITDEKFVWDASGNRLNGSKDPVKNSIRPRPVVINNGLFEDAEPMGEQVGRFSFIYDMHGNVIKKFDNQENIYYIFEHDGDNKLVYAEKYKNDSLLLKARYTYDGLGRRIEKEITEGSIVTRKSYIYDGDNILLEYNTSGATPIEVARYIGTGETDDNLMVIKNGRGYFYHKDHLGSITAVTNDAGEVIQKNHYSSFGKILSIKNKERKEIGIQGAVEKSFAYTGREWDEEIDLYYYKARHYDPQVGRFMQQDPIGLMAGDTNLYRYVQNKPLKYIDPNGLDAYLASRDVYFNGAPASHNFIVIQNTFGIQVISFGIGDNGTLQNVIGTGTHQTDIASLTNLDTMFVRIKASDAEVLASSSLISNLLKALQLQYTLPGTSNLTLNSNTAAQAVANLASGTSISPPSSSILGPLGYENADYLVRACRGRQ